MSTRFNNGSHYENHQKAAEMHELAAHIHRAADQHSDNEHESGHERTRQALEHSHAAHLATQEATVGHGVIAFGHAEIAETAHRLWVERGCPEGSPDIDWQNATHLLRAQHTPAIAAR